MIKWKRIALILAIPGTIVLNISLGQLDHPQTIEAFSPPPPPDVASILNGASIPSQQQMSLRFVNAEGLPAQNALVLASKPDLVSAYTDENGEVTLPFWREQEAKLIAWLPGHKVFSSDPFPPTQSRVFQFTPLKSANIEFATPLNERQLQIMCVRSKDQSPINGAILLLTAETPQSPDWLAISNENGNASFSGLSQKSEDIRVFTPGMPPLAAWELTSTREGSLMQVDCYDIKLTGLNHNDLISGERFFADTWHPLPLRLANQAGESEYLFLPTGKYRFTSNAEQFVLQVPASALELSQTIEFASTAGDE